MRAARRGIAAWWIAAALMAATVPALAQAPAPGATLQTAIVLPGIQHETEGVSAEYAYIAKNFLGWKPGMQALLSDKGRRYDSIDLTGPDGSHKTIFFDITEWFGK